MALSLDRSAIATGGQPGGRGQGENSGSTPRTRTDPEQGNRIGPRICRQTIYLLETTVVTASKPLKQLGFLSLQADMISA
jgi:hypothetical protein